MKVGLGVASVLSGNPLVGSVMIAFAAGSLGTSLMWKVHRDRQKEVETPERKHNQTRFFSTGTSRCCIAAHRSRNPHDHASRMSDATACFLPDERENKHVRQPQKTTDSVMSSMQCEVLSGVPAHADAWSRES